MAEAFPFYLPGDAHRLFTSQGVARRILTTARWNQNAKLLEVHGSDVGVMLAKELGCQVTVTESDPAALELLKAKAKTAALGDRLVVKELRWPSLPFTEASLDGVVVLGRVLGPLEDTVTALRPLLATRGRLAITWPVKVGLKPYQPSVDYWEARLGSPLRLPRECLMAVERLGYEPETAETVTDGDLDEYYTALEAQLARATGAQKTAAQPLIDELRVHRDAGGRSGVSMALLVARRKEPGERPPAVRDGG